jgi:hypothetical protein
MNIYISPEHKNWITFELKMIFRNRRPRNTMLFYVLGYAALILVYLASEYQVLLYNYLLISSVYFTYSPLMFSWESKYYGSIYSKNIMIRDLIKSKIRVLQLINIAFLLLLIPFILFEPAQLAVLSLLTVFNAGIYPYTDVLLASYNKRKVSLNKGMAFSLEGNDFLNTVSACKTIFIGILIYLIIEIIPGSYRLILPGILSMAGLFNFLLCPKLWVNKIEDNLHKRKYLMLEGFRFHD